jgi:hypothetical protein
LYIYPNDNISYTCTITPLPSTPSLHYLQHHHSITFNTITPLPSAPSLHYLQHHHSITFSTITPLPSTPSLHYLQNQNPVKGKVYSIQHYVIKFVSDLQKVGGFLRILLFPTPIKLIATI